VKHFFSKRIDTDVNAQLPTVPWRQSTYCTTGIWNTR